MRAIQISDLAYDYINLSPRKGGVELRLDDESEAFSRFHLYLFSFDITDNGRVYAFYWLLNWNNHAENKNNT